MKKSLILLILLTMVIMPVFASDYDVVYADSGVASYTIDREKNSYQSTLEDLRYLYVAHVEYYNGLYHYMLKSKNLQLSSCTNSSMSTSVTVRKDTIGGDIVATGAITYSYVSDTGYFFVTLNLFGGIDTTGESGHQHYYLDYDTTKVCGIQTKNTGLGVCDHATDPSDYDIGFRHVSATETFFCQYTTGDETLGYASIDWDFAHTVHVTELGGTSLNVVVDRNGIISNIDISTPTTMYYDDEEVYDINITVPESKALWNITNPFNSEIFSGEWDGSAPCTLTLYCRDAMTGNLIHSCNYNIENLDTGITAYYDDKLNPFYATVAYGDPLEITVLETTHETWISTDEYEDELSCPDYTAITIYLQPLTTGAPEGFTIAYAKTYWSSTGAWPYYTLPSVYINATGEYGNSSSEMTDSTGSAYFFVQKNATYTFTAIKSGYASDIQVVDIGVDPVNLQFILVPTGALPTTVTMTPTITTTQNYTGIDWEKNTAARKGIEWGIIGLIYENGMGIANLFVLWIYMAIFGSIIGSLAFFGGKKGKRGRKW